MFLENKYKVWYFSIIENARFRYLDTSIYTEKHHIIPKPKCMGGSNMIDNLIVLTAREHFVCHRLLVKFVEGSFWKIKMNHALGRFVQCSSRQDRKLTSHQYQLARSAIMHARKGCRHSAETREKMSKARQGQVSQTKGRTNMFRHSAEAKSKISAANNGKSFIERFGEEGAKIAIEKLRASKVGKPSGMLGKKHSEETKLKQSGPRSGSPHIRKICPHCYLNEQTPRHIKFCANNSSS